MTTSRPRDQLIAGTERAAPASPAARDAGDGQRDGDDQHRAAPRRDRRAPPPRPAPDDDRGEQAEHDRPGGLRSGGRADPRGADARARRRGDHVVERDPGEVGSRTARTATSAGAGDAERRPRGDDRGTRSRGPSGASAATSAAPATLPTAINSIVARRLNDDARLAPTWNVVATTLAPTKIRKRSTRRLRLLVGADRADVCGVHGA